MYMLFSRFSLLLLIPLAIYFYFFFKRMIMLFVDEIKPAIKVLIFILSVGFVYPANYIWGIWAMIIMHFFVFCIVVDMIVWLVKKYTHSFKHIQWIYQTGIIPLLCVLIVLGFGYMEMKGVQVQNYTISTNKVLTQDYRIAFITDLHFGNTMNKNELKQYCQDISSYQPDIVFLGGDIIDEKTTYQQMQDAFAILGQINNQYGIYYVYGNHDQAYYSPQPPFTTQDIENALTNANISLLSDTVQNIQSDLTIIGRKDRSENRQTSQTLLENSDHNRFIIMLDHQPVDLSINDELKVDLQLSGHTHGGQIFPVGLISDLLGFGEMNYGYRQMNDMQVIVSSGIAGWGYPIRTGSQSEYVIIDIIK